MGYEEIEKVYHKKGVILDSRPLHHAKPHSPAIRDAQQKKPKLPVHAVVTANNPLIRFIGGDVLADNQRWFESWQQRLPDWAQQHQPYLFIHTPDNSDSPQQAQKIWQGLYGIIPNLSMPPGWPEQEALF